ncbi:hypothetical protein KEM54_002499 [Ascosphaera aggregata]|nr:hypothetical protein KEM54_002499 [Ascosphaera aggregata]
MFALPLDTSQRPSEHIPASFLHSALTPSTMSRDRGSTTGHSTLQEDAVDPSVNNKNSLTAASAAAAATAATTITSTPATTTTTTTTGTGTGTETETGTRTRTRTRTRTGTRSASASASASGLGLGSGTRTGTGTTTTTSNNSNNNKNNDINNSSAASDQNKTAPPPQKKKKGQRFFCTDFPPCNLSFTRSEHLARHIRKHTGERPFQCHCTRRFSRLDNLRQHAQTVHCNEPIPPDSLANTGSSHFARAARSERARKHSRVHAGRGSAAAAAAAAATAADHGRNLSTSSISSVISTYSQGHDLRRRPPSLPRSNDGTARARLSLDASADPLSPSRAPPAAAAAAAAASASAASASAHWLCGASPTSAAGTFTSNSPYTSPPAEVSYFPPQQPPQVSLWDHRRRLSVPTAGSSYPPPTYAPRHLWQTLPSPEEQSAYPPPTNGLAAVDSRRRTWHTSPNDAPTFSPHSRPSTSGSEQYWYPNSAEVPPQFTFHQPDYNAPRKDEVLLATKLPGIESFDQPPPPPRDSISSDRQGGNLLPIHPMELSERRTSVYPSPFESRVACAQPPPPPPLPSQQLQPQPQPQSQSQSQSQAHSQPHPSHPYGHKRSAISFDAGIRCELTKLDLADHSPVRELSHVAPRPPARKNEWMFDTVPVLPITSHMKPGGNDTKAPLVTTTEIPLPGKLDTNRLDVLVAVATGEARAS